MIIQVPQQIYSLNYLTNIQNTSRLFKVPALKPLLLMRTQIRLDKIWVLIWIQTVQYPNAVKKVNIILVAVPHFEGDGVPKASFENSELTQLISDQALHCLFSMASNPHACIAWHINVNCSQKRGCVSRFRTTRS